MMTSSYCLAIDVGTNRTSAATARCSPDGNLVAAAFPLGRNTDNAPTAVYVAEGELLFGDAAERRGIAHPERLIHEFKRRIGDAVPILAGDQRFTPEELYARTVTWVVDAVSEREGRQPETICVTVPVTWGSHRTELVRAAIEAEGWADIELIAEPEAAARHYESTSPLEPGHSIAVYDLGGGTFDAVILRKGRSGDLEIVGEPVGIADLGGADFDDAVFRHVLASAEVSPPASAPYLVPLAALRRECVAAKESLSFDSEAVVPVMLGATPATVRIMRPEFEAMIQDAVDRTTDLLADAWESAQVEVDAILLTGGSSRIPRIAQVVSERFDRPVAIDADPKAIIALGAARAMASRELVALRAGVSLAPITAASHIAATADQSRPLTDAVPKQKWYRRTSSAAIAGGSLVLVAGIVIASVAANGGGAPASEPEAGDEAFLASLGITFGDDTTNADTLSVTHPPNATPLVPVLPPASAVDAPGANPRTRSMAMADKASKSDAATPAPRATNESASPSASPSPRPSKTTTAGPSKVPASSASTAPSKSPTKAPSKSPSKSPTKAPSKSPTKAPSPTASTPPAKGPITTPPKTPPTTHPTPAPTRNVPDPDPSPPTQTPTPTPTPAHTTPPTSSPTTPPPDPTTPPPDPTTPPPDPTTPPADPTPEPTTPPPDPTPEPSTAEPTVEPTPDPTTAEPNPTTLSPEPAASASSSPEPEPVPVPEPAPQQAPEPAPADQ